MPRNLASALILAGIGIATLSACSSWNNPPAASNPPRAGGQPVGTQYSMAATPARHELTPDMVRQVQQDLQQEGVYKGTVDGIWGPATQASLKNYQQSHGLNATGAIDSTTLAALNLPGNAAPPANAQPPQQQQQPQPAASAPNEQPGGNNPPAGDSTPANPPASQPPQDNGSPPPQ